MLIIHGEDTKSSFNRLNQLIKEAKAKGQLVKNYSGNSLDITLLRQEVSSTDLFATPNLLIITGLLSQNKSKTKDAVIKTPEPLERADEETRK